MSENNKTHWKYEYGMKVVYVFGSNEAGRHGKGYALVCKKKYGAIQGRGFGLQGMCYAIPTKDGKIKTLPLSRIKLYVDMFIEFAKEHNDMYFKVSNIGEEEIQDIPSGGFSFTEEKILSELEEDLVRDAQLRHAVSLLASWDVMVGILKQDKQTDKPTHLSFDNFNR